MNEVTSPEQVIVAAEALALGGLVLLALFVYALARRDNKKYQEASTPEEVVVHGGGRVLFTLVCAVLVLAIVLGGIKAVTP